MDVVLFAWLFSSIACAVIASAKGKSAFAWFFLGLLFGIFAILYLAFSSAEVPVDPGAPLTYDKNTGKVVVVSDTKACPYCAEDIKAEAIKCKHCGSDLVAGESSVADDARDAHDAQGARVLK